MTGLWPARGGMKGQLPTLSVFSHPGIWTGSIFDKILGGSGHVDQGSGRQQGLGNVLGIGSWNYKVTYDSSHLQYHWEIILSLCSTFPTSNVRQQMMLSLPDERYQGRHYIEHGDSPLFSVWHIQSRQSGSTVKHAQIIPHSTQLRASRSIVRPEDT